jgi:hypothetical protein
VRDWDCKGIYQDETLPTQLKEKAQAVKDDEEVSSEEKVEQLVRSLAQTVRRFVLLLVEEAATDVSVVLALLQSEQLGLMQKKIAELNAKCILLKQRKAAGAWARGWLGGHGVANIGLVVQ